MRNFKVIRMNVTSNKLFEEDLMFADFETADNWATEENNKVPGSVVDLALVDEFNDEKYEY